jgi:hypothetical protein
MTWNVRIIRERCPLFAFASALWVLSLVAGIAVAADDKPFSQFRWRSIGLAASGWMRSICADPRNADVLWAVADMGGGIVRTVNGGRSWEDVTYNAIRDTKQGNFARV